MKNNKILSVVFALIFSATLAACSLPSENSPAPAGFADSGGNVEIVVENEQDFERAYEPMPAGDAVNAPPVADGGATNRAMGEAADRLWVATAPDSEYELSDADYIMGQDEPRRPLPPEEGERYGAYYESPFLSVQTNPLSTFSASPNTASYSNMRRFINNGMTPQGVRIEELINYFDYDYPKPQGEEPFAIHAEVADCPWNSAHLLAKIGIQGKDIDSESRLPNNVVFLIDVSGSMDQPNRLPLVQQSFVMLLDNLNQNDKISIVTYAGSERVLADGVNGNERGQLEQTIRNLTAGGSTAGAQGIITAYELARKNFITGGNNRVILATDGDFNVGVTSTDALVTLIAKEKEQGVFLTVLGYGMYNLNDYMMESIAKEGNGSYAYIDTIEEAHKVLVQQFNSTMYVIAKDLKIQVEFNPATVSEYRLIGYDNRRLADEDFNNDQKDAGDIGAGFAVTALYQLIPVGAVEPLRYQEQDNLPPSVTSDDYMTVKTRYKEPDGDVSILNERAITKDLYTTSPSDSFNFASAVAEFGLILTNSNYKGSASVANVLTKLSTVRNDTFGLRREFAGLVEKYDGQLTMYN
ncbi:MAG: VWA domain-containing protein [Oscillospiraceae bacterium]|nr:VWA domain-containing protein [Oscillospiraceae bacterium]